MLRRRRPLLVPARGAQPIDDKNEDDEDDAIAEEEESSIGDANEGSGGPTRTRDRDLSIDNEDVNRRPIKQSVFSTRRRTI